MAKKDGLVVAIGVGKPKPAPGDEGLGGLGDEEEAPPEEEGLLPEEEGEEPAAEEESEGAYPEFSIPEGLDLSDLEPGEEKEVIAIISKTSDTECCIKQVDGIDLAGESQGMYGPPPAAPVPPPPPAGGPPPGMPPPGIPRGMPASMPMPPGMPPPGMLPRPGAPVRAAAARRGLMP